MPLLSADRAARITQLLQDALAPARLEVRDESHLHAGHNADAAGGGTHVRITIASPALAGLSRVDQHRRINDLLREEFQAGLHACAIVIKPV